MDTIIEFINDLPRDAWAYYSCDDLPEIPDGEAVFRQNRFSSLPSAFGLWFQSGTIYNVSYDGKININVTSNSGIGGATGGAIVPNGLLIIEFDVTGQASIGFEAFAVKYSAGTHVFFGFNTSAVNQPLRIYAYPNSTIRVSSIYIGNGSYQTPLFDNSGNGRHMRVTGGTLPITAVRGNGLNFLGTGGAYISNPNELFSPEGDFTFALWINKYATGAAQYVLSNVESGGGISIIINADGRIQVTYYRAGTTGTLYLTMDNAPDNKWVFLIIKYNSGVRRFYVKIDNIVVSTGNILPGPIDWSTVARGVPLALGANPGQFTTSGTSSLSGFFSGLLDEVAIFTRFTTDAEDTAMYKTSLPKFFNPSISREPRYLGKTADIGGSNGVAAIQVTSTLTQSVQAFPGDWVAYIGGTSGAWVNGMCMRWTGTAWLQIPVELDGNFESNPYMLAMFDLTNNAPSAAFMTLMVQNLVAKTAMIEKIFTSLLKVNNNGAVFGGPRFMINAQGQLIDNGANLAGFKLGADGKLLASNVDISGRIEAESGIFTNVTGVNMDIIGGVINIGPLYASEEAAPSSTVIPSTTLVHVAIHIINNNFNWPTDSAGPTTTTIPTPGWTLNGQPLSNIVIRSTYPSNHTITFNYTGNSIVRNGRDASLGFVLEGNRGASGKMFKLIGLSSVNPGNSNPNIVWKDSAGYLRIS